MRVVGRRRKGFRLRRLGGPAAVRLRANFSRPSRSALAFPRPAPGLPCFFLLLIGYGRVSTAEQNRDHQIDALHRAGVATGCLRGGFGTPGAARCHRRLLPDNYGYRAR